MPVRILRNLKPAPDARGRHLQFGSPAQRAFARKPQDAVSCNRRIGTAPLPRRYLDAVPMFGREPNLQDIVDLNAAFLEKARLPVTFHMSSNF